MRLPGLRIDGKPQCHIVAVAKQEGEVAVSVGCMLSRARTAMPRADMTCAIPASRLHDVVARFEATAATDSHRGVLRGGGCPPISSGWPLGRAYFLAAS